MRKALAAYGDEPLRSVVMRMAETGITRMPVLDESGSLQGMVSLRDLLRARVRNLEEERRRERILKLRVPFVLPRRSGSERAPFTASRILRPPGTGNSQLKRAIPQLWACGFVPTAATLLRTIVIFAVSHPKLKVNEPFGSCEPGSLARGVPRTC